MLFQGPIDLYSVNPVFTKTHWSEDPRPVNLRSGHWKLKIKKSDWLLVFIKLFMIYFRGPVKNYWGPANQTIHWSYWPASLNSFREDWCAIRVTKTLKKNDWYNKNKSLWILTSYMFTVQNYGFFFFFFFFCMLELRHRCCHSISFLLDGDDLGHKKKTIINFSHKFKTDQLIWYHIYSNYGLTVIIDNTHLISKHWTIICFLPPKSYCLIWFTWNSCVMKRDEVSYM